MGSSKDAVAAAGHRCSAPGSVNREQGVDPQPLRKRIRDITDMLAR